ncbi:MAG: hypothetical protein D6730_03125 [Bacteroidetes bacterium]|nr:MAG: hypothetical protein D6730_03125 [Bacteroidota bacterium]
MKTDFWKKLGVLALMLCLAASTSFAQKGAKRIAPADKKALIDIFKDVDPGKYRLVFSDGKTYGKKRIKMSDLRETGHKLSPEAAGVKWTLIAGDRSENEVIYIYTEGLNELVSVIGREKANKLRSIASKYVR